MVMYSLFVKYISGFFSVAVFPQADCCMMDSMILVCYTVHFSIFTNCCSGLWTITTEAFIGCPVLLKGPDELNPVMGQLFA